MVTQAISSFGIAFKIGDGGGPESFTTVAEVLDFNGPGLQGRTTEVTSHDAQNAWAEFVGTIKDGGEITFTVNFVPAHGTHNPTSGLLDDLQTQVLRNFQVVFPDTATTTWLLSGVVTGFTPVAPVDGALTADVSVKISGEPTLA